ncbi:S8 family serine peptidase [Pendulispora albinea]|uniref:S8 family serine peptidase n=1 Tax=Pendulispora albinea TaxID=2741071 RepID=A0ABZ2M8R0_9BACT
MKNDRQPDESSSPPTSHAHATAMAGHVPETPETRNDAASAPDVAISEGKKNPISVRIPAAPLRGERESHDPRARAPLPIGERIGADTRFSGRGIVAAFLDSGFYAHPDLTTPHSRIHAYHDLIHEKKDGVELLNSGDGSSWHGMMSTVVAAGNGALSNGRFRSVAPDLGLVLVKVGTLSRVHHDDIARGIEWVLVNRGRYDIRILNISAGGDYEASYLDDVMSRFAEAAIRAGIVVVAAVGNQGHRPGYVVPPASVPAVISVGGIDDRGNPHFGQVTGYRSSYGPTIDGLQKPEVVTVANWIAAPILPGTLTASQIALLAKLHKTADGELEATLAKYPGVIPSLDEAKGSPLYLIRQVIEAGLRDELVINEHYKMVDGTSFAAPIVTSVIAQMLEANPRLKPLEIKRILLKTAKRLPNLEVDRQGWGVVDPKAAVEHALRGT